MGSDGRKPKKGLTAAQERKVSCSTLLAHIHRLTLLEETTLDDCN